MRYFQRKHDHERGFTIIELMIATAILATILVLLTAMIIGIGKLYYKGLNQARVQDATRSVIDDVSQQLQLSGATPLLVNANISGIPMNAYCIGTTRYSFVVGKQIGTGTDITTSGTTPQIPHVLWRDTNTSGGCAPLDLTQNDPTAAAPVGTSANGSELTPPNSRLTDFSIAGMPPAGVSPYAVSIEVAYGNSDLLSSTSGPAGSVVCKVTAGEQYCATASLTTTIVSRL
jgi:prepilin-type N-terminal cleavage/methylation domain-containing protein